MTKFKMEEYSDEAIQLGAGTVNDVLAYVKSITQEVDENYVVRYVTGICEEYSYEA